MKQYFIQRKGSTQLVLFFAGWGMDEHPFAHYCSSTSDLMVCYDYRTLDFSAEMLRDYKEIHLVAWSLGVWVASQVMAMEPRLKALVVQSTAINGTLYPIDETRGISPAIYQGTLTGLTEASLQKFQRRMCVSVTDYRTFCAHAPQRSIPELSEELAALLQCYTTLPQSPFRWDKAIVGAQDKIFLPTHQLAAWNECTTPIVCTDHAHYASILLMQSIENYG